MVGHGWKQLAEWSIEFSCLTESEKREALRVFRTEWEDFCRWVVDEHGAYADALELRPQ